MGAPGVLRFTTLFGFEISSIHFDGLRVTRAFKPCTTFLRYALHMLTYTTNTGGDDDDDDDDDGGKRERRDVDREAKSRYDLRSLVQCSVQLCESRFGVN